MYKKLLTLCGIGLMSLTVSCAGSMPAIQTTVNDYCLIAKTISFSIKNDNTESVLNQYDTDATIEEIMAHNTVYDRLCEISE